MLSMRHAAPCAALWPHAGQGAHVLVPRERPGGERFYQGTAVPSPSTGQGLGDPDASDGVRRVLEGLGKHIHGSISAEDRPLVSDGRGVTRPCLYTGPRGCW